MSNDLGPNAKKRTRVLDDLEEDLEGFGKREVPPPPVVLPGGYKDEANPFNDAQLSAPFQWKLRNQKLGKDAQQGTLSKEEEAAQREETMREIESLRQRRIERERDEAAWELEQARLAREREQLMSVGWEKDEDRFLLSQLKMLALKRLQELRPHSIDLLFLIYAAYTRIWMRENNVIAERPKSSVEQQLQTLEAGLVLPRNLPSPDSILRDVSLVSDCRALTEDIQLFFAVESDSKMSSDAQSKAKTAKPANITSASSYWSAVQVLIDEREKELIAKDPSQAASTAAASDIILPEVLETIDSMMEGKTIEELRELEEEVNTLLSAPADPSAPIDEEYWRSLMVRLKYFKAREHVNSVYKMVLKDIRENPNANAKELPEMARIVASSSTGAPKAAEKYEDEFEELDENQEGAPAMRASETASYFGLEGEEQMLDEETLMRMEMAKGLGKDETAFGDEDAMALEKTAGPSEDQMRSEIRKALQGFQMGDKFRPRKPKYYNRVKIGFEWTKYNQIHYDHDNPPPKVVQGYKFTVFYPDLIDPTKAPTFSIEPTESPDYAILRFHAGPPYIDIAFRIANREWSVAPKHGYKCMFARGVLYLWFNFKRMRYRR